MVVALSKRNSFGFAIILVMLAVIGLISYHSVAQTVSTRAEAKASRDIIADVDALYLSLADAEISQRGYLLTGKEHLLAPYRAAVERISTQLPAAKRHFQRDVADIARGERLESLVDLELKEFADVIAVRRQDGLGVALALLEDERGRFNAEEIRRILVERGNQERAAQKRRIEQLDHVTASTVVLVLASSFVGIAFVLLAVFLVNKELLERRRAEKELRDNEAELSKEKQRLASIITTQYDIALSDLNLEKMMQVIVDRTQVLTRASGCIIEILEGDEMVYRAAGGTAASRVGFRLKATGSLSGLCLETGETLRCDDSETDPRVDKVSCRTIGVRSMVVVPLRHMDKIVGVLKAFSAQPNIFTDSDMESLKLIGGLLGSSMSHAAAFEARQKAEQAALEASRLKSNFLATMSHEIRTPINGVIGMAHLLKDTQLTEMQADYLDNIKRSAEALLTVINDILDFSKVEAGKMDLEMIDFDPDQLISDIEKTMSYAARQKGLHFTVRNPGNWPNYFVGDSGRLRQVLLNLLSNAIKFTDQGSVEFRIHLQENNERNALLLFEIEDTGIGMSERTLGRLFQAFSQADASTTRRFGGTGLGLSISKRLTELMGGEIGVKSFEKIGSTFWVRIRLQKGAMRSVAVPDGSLPTRMTAVRKEMHILIAEDNLINQKVASGFVEKMGHRTSIVNNGREAVAFLQTQSVDLVLMDCQMPEMDGYEATGAIRRFTESSVANVPIVAMTANAIKGDRERCLAAGMNDYLSKPIKPSELQKLLEKWLRISEDPIKSSFAKLEFDQDKPIVDVEIVDNLRGLASAGNFATFINDLLATYQGAVRDQLKVMHDALREQDHNKLSFQAHSMKSASLNMGAARLAALCQAAETSPQAVGEPSLQQMQREIDAFLREMSRIISAPIRQAS